MRMRKAEDHSKVGRLTSTMTTQLIDLRRFYTRDADNRAGNLRTENSTFYNRMKGRSITKGDAKRKAHPKRPP